MRLKNYNTYFFILILIIVSGLVALLFAPFISAILTAGILTATFYRPYRFLLKNTNNNEVLSSIATCLIVLFVIIIPIGIVVGLVVNETTHLYQQVKDNGDTYSEIVSNSLENFDEASLVYSFDLDRLLEKNQIIKSIQEASRNILVIIQKTTQNIVGIILWIFVMFFSLYYFLIEGKSVIKKVMYLSPLKDEYEEDLSRRFASMVRATLKGTIIVGSIQGVLGGMMFAIAGIPSFVIWGVIMIILSIIPAIGSALIWIPAGLIMLFMGNIWQGVFILVFGSVVISFIDNILRPKLVGNDTAMHPLLVFFATLGGLIIFGILGFIIGPVIMALFLALWEIYGKEFKGQLKKYNA